jgi:UDP-N-acetylglucosamine 2-epimerase (non-hydrolysing)
MIDTLLACRERALASDVLTRLGIEEEGYGVVTLHRPANVDDPESLARLTGALERIGARLPLVFPAHPRTRARLEAAGFKEGPALRLLEPLGYLDFLRLMAGARLILTDSGGIQEEACILDLPCLTLRENTERPATIETGLNALVGSDPERIVERAGAWLDRRPEAAMRPESWDGKAAERIAEIVCARYGAPS